MKKGDLALDRTRFATEPELVEVYGPHWRTKIKLWNEDLIDYLGCNLSDVIDEDTIEDSTDSHGFYAQTIESYNKYYFDYKSELVKVIPRAVPTVDEYFADLKSKNTIKDEEFPFPYDPDNYDGVILEVLCCAKDNLERDIKRGKAIQAMAERQLEIAKEPDDLIDAYVYLGMAYQRKLLKQNMRTSPLFNNILSEDLFNDD